MQNKKKHPATLIIKHFQMLMRLTRDSIRRRYAGSILGVGWMIMYPITMLGIYSVLYLLILKIRPVNMLPIQYVLYIFAGLVPLLMFSEALNIGAFCIVDNRDLLNNTVFPIDLLPVKSVLESQGFMVVGMIVIIALSTIFGFNSVLMLLTPIIWFLQLLFMIGLLWILSLIGIIFRDLRYILPLLTTILILASPIAYTLDMVPDNLKLIVYINPIAYYSISYQKIMVLGELPKISEILIMLFLSLGTFIFGGRLFAS